MNRVRIYQPSKTAMQSGRAGTTHWVLEPELATRREPEPVIGWVSSGDTLNQVRLRFDTKDEAIAYAEKHGMQYVLLQPRQRRLRPKAYADNFAYGRTELWTH